MKSVMVFPGQGAQFVGMGKDFYDNFSVSREVFECVDDSLNYRLSKIIFDGPSDELTLTKHTQPALMATSIAILEAIKSETGCSVNKIADYAAGHSLGEYTALCAVNAFSLSDTARLLQIRGESMQIAVPQGKGAMAAILGMDEGEIEDYCEKVRDLGICQIANDNCPGQIVVSGSSVAIEKIISLLQENGKKVVKLSVSAPFHCALMDPVKETMHNALINVKINDPIIPLVGNVIASVEDDLDKIKNNLVEQVSFKVRWSESMQYLIKQGVERVIEIGAGKVLCGLTKRIDKNISNVNIGNIDDFKSFCQMMKC